MARTSSLKVRKLLETVLLVGKNLLSCLVSLDTYKDGPLDCSSKKHPKVDKSLPNPDQIIGSPTSTCFCNSNPYLYLRFFRHRFWLKNILNKELSFDVFLFSNFCCLLKTANSGYILQHCIKHRLKLLFCGPTGTGKILGHRGRTQRWKLWEVGPWIPTLLQLGIGGRCPP